MCSSDLWSSPLLTDYWQPPIEYAPRDYGRYVRDVEAESKMSAGLDIKWPDHPNANMTVGFHPVATREENLIDFHGFQSLP